jgi:adiponectin receptor
LYYFKSIFTKHNETINSLSHYAGALYCLSYFFRIDFTNEYSWPFFTVILTAIIMFVSSATAHLLHQKSQKCHMICFLFDFTGISIHGFSSAFIQAFYCSPNWYFSLINTSLIPILGFMSMSCCFLNCLAQTNYKRPYPPIKRFLQFAPCVLLWAYTVLPTVLHLLPGEKKTISIDTLSHLKHIILLIIGAAFFTLEIPQRFYPGKLDFFGQGHHLFHLCVFFGVIFQINACYDDYTRNYDLIVSTRPKPTMEICFLSVLLLLVYDFFIIRIFSKMIEHNFDVNGNLIKLK